MVWFFDMLSAAIYAVIVQNLVFNGGYGISEAIRMASKPKKLFSTAGMIIYFSTVTAVICRLLDYIPVIESQNQTIHFLIFFGVLMAVYFVSGALSLIILKPDKRFMTKISMCAMNTLVMAIPLINHRSVSTFWESIGTAFGSGVAFIVASLLISVGFTKIAHNKKIPEPFKGTPIMFIYVALLSMAVTGITGSGVFA
ncbi:MAG: hypothetical protein IJZ57_07920 [Clostridia bacterium]|nr:hypothetical protein [Clostridia bacterium]